MYSNDWLADSDSFQNASSDFWGESYSQPAEDFSNWGSDVSFGGDTYVDYGGDNWSFTDRPKDSGYTATAGTEGDSSWLDKAGTFVGDNWKELLGMFGGGLMGGLSPSSAPRPPSGGSGGGGGASGPTTTEALAGKSYSVVKG